MCNKPLIDSELQPHVLQRLEQRIVHDVRPAARALKEGRGVGEDELFEIEPARVLTKLLPRGVEEPLAFVVELAEIDFESAAWIAVSHGVSNQLEVHLCGFEVHDILSELSSRLSQVSSVSSTIVAAVILEASFPRAASEELMVGTHRHDAGEPPVP
ncbi:MAG TPA: hypothetical protein VNA69_23245 [Thermoanaerobaculia bacterium]|nr:hypothetical protein [Thermoanaerobaculia bacterium]